MKMKSQRKIDRDRARRDARSRLRDARPGAATGGEGDDAELTDDDLDLAVARSLMGYDE